MPPMLLSSILGEANKPFILLQSSFAQTSLPLLRALCNGSQTITVMCCLLHSPTCFVDSTKINITVVDITANVPGYCDQHVDSREIILKAMQGAPAGPLTVLIDSADTLLSDLGSVSQTYTFISDLLALVRARPAPSRLVVHANPACAPPGTDAGALVRLLTQTRFSPALAHAIAHPPALVRHVAGAYGTPPPPLAPPERFWRVFAPIAERGLGLESERLVFGPDGEGTGGDEIVFEVLVRGAGDAVGTGRKSGRGVERVLEGWAKGQPCELKALDSLKSVFSRKIFVEEKSLDPTQNVTFNLALTPEQQQSRAQVPLPYAHEGKPVESAAAPGGAIYYDPDSADDIDDDDPDEDLDI